MPMRVIRTVYVTGVLALLAASGVGNVNGTALAESALGFARSGIEIGPTRWSALLTGPVAYRQADSPSPYR